MSSSKETKAPAAMLSEDWAELPWRKLEQHAYRLQKRIYRASERGNKQVVHRLQQVLMKSRSAQLLAVRRVTQDNQGKKTAGVDGKTVLTGPERLELATEITPKANQRKKPLPVRRVWIPKPGKTERRPLGIPTIRDRATQALVKMALEPEWEARFEPNSYGFRPGRGCHDAIGAVFLDIQAKPKYVLDADIAGCFDHINQQALLRKLETYPALRRTIRAWLKAGVMEGVTFTPTEEGTPQGGVISPLLANIALHGMEEAVDQAFRPKDKPQVVRYADDFVIFHATPAGIEKAQQVVAQWLQGIGLELKPSKTKQTHTLERHQGNWGFDFLGFTVRQVPVGKYHSGTNHRGKPLGFKTIITPSKEAVKRHMKVVNTIARKHGAAPQKALIVALNPVVRGWANYYRTVVSKRIYEACDTHLFQVLLHWAKRRHPQKGAKWVVTKYWTKNQGQGWQFVDSERNKLLKYAATPIKRHVKVQGRTSPYNGDLTYWAKRLKEHPLLNGEKAKLLQMQHGICPICGLTFRSGDLLETDHLIPKRLGGRDILVNKVVSHRHCHDWKTARDGSNQARGI